MAWEEESIQLEVSDTGGRKNKIKLILIGVGGLVLLLALGWLVLKLFSGGESEEPEQPTQTLAQKPVAPVEKPVELVPEESAEPVGDGTRVDLERFVVHLSGEAGAAYLVFDASLWVKGEAAQVLADGDPDEAMVVTIRHLLFQALSGLTREGARDEDELRELGARLRAPLAKALGKSEVTQILIKARQA